MAGDCCCCTPLYDTIGIAYARHRVPDPRIAAAIDAALGDAASVANVGAGTGSYEPRDRQVVAIEPSETMIAQRGHDAAPALQGSAESIPLDDDSVDAAMAVLTIHHWGDIGAGLREMRRVARRRVVILTWDPESEGFWLVREYFPEIIAFDRTVFPTMGELRSMLGPITVRTVPVPHDCRDGFLAAYWRRPHAYLDASVRSAISAFARLDDVTPGIDRLRADLEGFAWHRDHSELAGLDELDASYRLVVAESGA